MFRVGLTGSVASGKSSVTRVWARLGATIIDADELARRAVAPGTPGLERVVEAFGPDILQDGTLDRAAMRRKVFSDPAARQRLEAIVHPEVGRLRDEEEARLAAEGAPVVVHDIPLLFEVGLAAQFDVVVVVDAPETVRADRLARERDLSPEEISGLMASQMSDAEKRARADIVIENSGTLEELEAGAEAAWAEITRRAGRAPRTMRMDMHIHTRISFDCRSHPDAVVARALERGLARICITDHNEIEAALDLAERYPHLVIPGEEVKTAEGVDITGLYVREWIPKGTPARETCEQIRAQGGLVYVPHPFAGGKGGGGRILPQIRDLVDIVEGFNARLHSPELNRSAQAWAAEHGLPQGAGSDAHTLGEIGNGYVELPSFRNDPDSLISALRQGAIHGRTASRLVHVASTVAKLFP
jgi:dephospho-CoA kinase